MHYLFIFFVSLFLTKTNPVIIVQVGSIKPSIIRSISVKIKETYHINTIVVRKDKLLKPSYFPTWNIYNTDMALAVVSKFYPDSRVIIVTNKPLACTAYYNFGIFYIQPVYGYTDNWKPICIISTNGLDYRYIHSEMNILAIHELGHTFGLSHCEDPYCYMTRGNGTTSGIDICYHFCDICFKQLNNE